MDAQKLSKSLDEAIQLLTEAKKELQGQEPVKTLAVSAEAPASPTTEEVDYSNFDQLKTALKSDKWPEAVNPNLLCNPDSETDKMDRSRGIIELMIEEDLKGLKFLDIGCGQGHCVDVSATYDTLISVGYDIEASPAWTAFEAKGNKVFTDNFDVVKANAPYDVILIFDVLDHIQGESPADLLTKAKSVLSDKGKIYLRVHPWSSRHATHLYYDLNKAYLHLVFTADELSQLVPESKHAQANVGVFYPLKTYGEWLETAGLKVLNRRDITEKTEPFFKIPKIAERIMKNAKTQSFPEFQLSLQFLDFVLQKTT